MQFSSITIGLGWPLCRSCRDYCSDLIAISWQDSEPQLSDQMWFTWPCQNYHNKKRIITWLSGQGHQKAQCGCSLHLVGCRSGFPLLLEGKSASSQLSLVQLDNLLSTAAKPSCRGHGLCAGTPGGHSAICTIVKVIGMHRPVHSDLKDTGGLTCDQSSSCVEVISCEMHAWIYTLP